MPIDGVVAGLGNPGPQYAGTRHNCGFAFVEALLEHARKQGTVSQQNGKKFSCDLHQCVISGQRKNWLLAMPQTFMNSSGHCVQPLLAWHRLHPDQLLVVHDELDIPAGALRFKFGGGDAGHNGLKSISTLLGTHDYYRLRIGIGKPQHREDMLGWVLGKPSAEDAPLIHDAIAEAVNIFLCFCNEGPEQALRRTRAFQAKGIEQKTK